MESAVLTIEKTSLIKLASKYINKHLFILTPLGRTYKENKRKVVIGGIESIVKTIKICLVGREEDLFNFTVKKGLGVFTASKHGGYRLPITLNQQLECSSEEEAVANGNYMVIECKEKNNTVIKDYVKIEKVTVNEGS